MRLRTRDGALVHLAYCSNVHPADDADGVMTQLERYAARVRDRLGVKVLGVGLWLSADAAAVLDGDAARIGRMRSLLNSLGLEVVTFNGFPYGPFHAERVKHDVYKPDWTTDARATYTLQLARILSQLLPDDVTFGSISTLPIAWREPWGATGTARACANLVRVTDGFATLEEQTGKRIALAIEPEPGCIIETTEQVAAFLDGLDTTRLGVCIDTAHLATQFEDPEAAIPALVEHAPIMKAQLSAALRVPDPSTAEAKAHLASFIEPRFLHQVRERAGDALLATDDLDEALDGDLPGEDEWRVHFHAPLHADPAETTVGGLETALAVLVGGARPLTRHLEIETYTWSVLPPEQRPVDDDGLIAGIAAEFEWVRARLAALGLEEAT